MHLKLLINKNKYLLLRIFLLGIKSKINPFFTNYDLIISKSNSCS